MLNLRNRIYLLNFFKVTKEISTCLNDTLKNIYISVFGNIHISIICIENQQHILLPLRF
jgi:hypothetical protein